MKRSLTNKELQLKVAELAARRLAMRDIVARLLAIVATMAPDQEAVFREFFEAGDERLRGAAPKTEGQNAMLAWIQDETDWIVQAAKTMVAKSN